MTYPQPTPSGQQRAGERHLQRRDALLRDLGDVDDQNAAQRLDRLGDADVLLQLQLTGFDETSGAWAEFARALIEYGYTVFRSWGITGLLYQKAARHGGTGVLGLSRIPIAKPLSPDDAHELAVELMFVSIDRFRRLTLMNPDPAKRWTPTGGASLRTFFIGRALMDLPVVYDRLFSKVAQPEPEHSAHTSSAEDCAVATFVVDDVLVDEPDDVKAMFKLQAIGYSLDEIAVLLTDAGFPATNGTVRTKMTHARTRAKERRS